MAAVLFLLFHHHLLLLPFLLPVYSGAELPVYSGAELSDADTLLLLKNSFTNAAALSSWTTGDSPNPCDPKSPWAGVFCLHDTIIGLHLADMGLSGSINVDALSHFPALRTVSFVNNSFSGHIPALGRLHTLKAIYLSQNHFSGPIPSDFFDGMTRLKKLWLNGNAFTGYIPYSLSLCTSLMELHLEDNHFSGSIPALLLPSLTSFNVSNNDLEGTIPDTYANFSASSFLGNKDLCGDHLGSTPCKTETQGGSGKMVAMFFLAIILVCLAIYLFTMRQKNGQRGPDSRDKNQIEVQTRDMSPGSSHMEYQRAVSRVESNRRYSRTASSSKPGEIGGEGCGGWGGVGVGEGGGGVGDLVMVNGGKGAFGLPDLMKAAAEVMGSGGLGSAYKAVMMNGVAVVVKRMRDMNRVGKESFDAEIRRLGGLAHPNVLPPLAYHYRKDEKLLVYEYIPKGSLLYVLHGDRGLDHASLDWLTRARIARGIARGLAYLHAQLPFDEAPHGNLKSGNVLLAPDFEPLLVDYGFLSLVNPPQAATAMQAHRSPEALNGRPVSPRSDVYCLGVLLLELLTGKFPSQYLTSTKGGTDVVYWATSAIGEGKEAEILAPAIVARAKPSVPDMKRLVRVGMECAQPNPDRRLELREAVERIEEIAAEAERAAPTPAFDAYAMDGLGERSGRWVGGIGDRSARRMGSIGDRSARRTVSIGDRSARRTAGIGERSARRTASIGGQSSRRSDDSFSSAASSPWDADRAAR